MLIIGLLLIQVPAVQSKIVEKVMEKVNEQFGTEVKVGHVNINFFGDIDLYDVTAKDHREVQFIEIPYLSADMDLIDLYRDSSRVNIDDLEISGADVKVITYKGESESNFVKFIDKFSSDDDSSSDFLLNGNLSLKNSKLQIINENLDEKSRVWLEASQLNVDLKNIEIEGGSYMAMIENLRFNAKKNGENYRLKDFTTAFKMTPTGLFFDKLNFETQSSHLNGRINLKYRDIANFSHFGDSVSWDIQLNEGNKFAYKDLRYFVPTWRGKEVIELSGMAKGNLNNLSLENFHAKDRATDLYVSKLNFSNLIDGDFGFYSKDIDVKTSYTDLKKIVPEEYASSITSFIKKFGQIGYKGDMSLYQTYLYANGMASTALGNGKLDLKMYDYSGDSPRYKGSVNTDRFDLGHLIDNKSLGNVSGNLNFDGLGYDVNKLSIKSKGKINYIEFNKERFNNIDVDGKLEKKIFDGFFAINDAGKARANYKGKLDFGSSNLDLDFDSNIEYLNLNYLGLSKVKNTWVKGNIKGNTIFSDLNNLKGDFEINDLTFNSDTIQMKLPLSNFSIYKDELEQKNIDIKIPNYLSAKLIGKFNLDEIETLFRNGIGNYMVEYDYKKASPGQYLNYILHIEDDILKYFIPEAKISENSLLAGTINDDNKIFDIDFKSPKVSYQNYTAEKLHFSASTSDNKSFNVTSEKIDINGFGIDNFGFNGKVKRDTLVANAHFYSGKDLFGEYDLNFYQTFNDKKKIKIGFLPSKLKIDDAVWNINQFSDSESNYAIIDLEKEDYNIVELLLNSEEQYLKVNAEYNDKDNYSVKADINEVKIEKSIPKYYIGDLGLKGVVNGELDITKSGKELKPIANVLIDSIYIKDKYVGKFSTNAKYDIENNEFEITGSLDRHEVNSLYITGVIDNKGEKPQVDLLANFDDFNVNLMDAFLSDILSQWKGGISGDVAIKGDLTNPNLEGNIITKDLGFKVVYLGTYYKMEGENEFSLNKQPGQSGAINLDGVKIVESSSNTIATADGLLIFSSIADWFMDLEFSSDKIMVLNTTVADNDLFYGKVFAKGDFYLFGPAVDLEVSTAKGAKVLAGSVVNINTGGTKTVGENKFIQFYSYDETGKLLEDEKHTQKVQGFSMDLRMDVDDKSTANLVLDAKSNDLIQAQGFAQDFRISMNKAGNLSINGDYDITKGTYRYRQGIIIDKDFQIEKGGLISFSGNPYNARLDLKAVYTRNVNNIGNYLGINYTQPTIMDLIIGISGDLKNTQIDLDIDAPEAGTQVRNLLKTKMKDDPDEKVKQVGSVLVLGRLDTSENLIAANTATDAATASAFELLGKQVGNAFSSIVPGLEINPTYLQSSDSKNQSDRIQTQFNLAINKRLSVNGAVGTPLGSQYNEKITTQLEVDYDISKKADGELRLRAFSRPSTIGLENYNVNSNYTQSYGAGVVYRKSFDNFGDLFRAFNSEAKLEEKIKIDSTKGKPKKKK